MSKKTKELEKKVDRLEKMVYDLWDKHSRLLQHLELEDVVIPQEKVIRKSWKITASEVQNEEMRQAIKTLMYYGELQSKGAE